ncbi:MAG TPA: GNAT family N-acetyltransferase [Candidatus Baltobacteraceae bacterium]|jgi:RimJ/RimL family protein N-acetyltransferase|nr:GNAT family N-acetyltransferase [Candidatus Baltobacteraceae bacterium]
MFSVAPAIATSRLILRPVASTDFAASAAMWSDPHVVRYITGKPSTPQESWIRLLRYAGLWPLLGFGGWVLEERESGEFAGEVGFADYHRTIEPSLDGIPELGWVLPVNMHGKGYATEAVRACVAWADANLPAASATACIISPENLPSIRVAEKCGFTLAHHTTYNGQPIQLFMRQRSVALI